MDYDIIIIGGSYSGLSAAMTLGRALRNVLIIDSGKPCNLQTPHSQNFITQDGNTPKAISSVAKMQVEKYKSIRFYNGLATGGVKTGTGFKITTQAGDHFSAKKLIFATGVRDIMPTLDGFDACWGISVIHCPYCHGYEYRDAVTGILANGDVGFETAKMISHWTKDLTIFTNGPSTFTGKQAGKLLSHHINIIEKEIARLEHTDGRLQNILFKDGTSTSVKALYSSPAFEQHCSIPEKLGCELTEHNLINVDAFQKTNVHGIFAIGDATTKLRAISNAVAMGTLSGAIANKEMIEELF